MTVNSCNTKRISSLEKSLSEKYVHIPGCQKNGAFHIGIQKNRAIHILFVEKKRGPIIYLAALKKGAIPGPDSGVGKRGTCPPEATASHILPPVFFDITLLCISYPDTCDLQKTEFINDNERAISNQSTSCCREAATTRVGCFMVVFCSIQKLLYEG